MKSLPDCKQTYGGKAAKRIKPALLKNNTLQIALFQTLLKNFCLSKSALFSKLKPSIHRHPQGISYLTLNKINYLIITRPLTTLAIGAYPAITLAEARQRREDAKKLLANGVDPDAMKKSVKQAKTALNANSFEIVAREWHTKFSGADK